MKINENMSLDLSDEQKKQIKSDLSPEEVLQFAKESGYELTPDQMESISGGGWGKNKGNISCPKCGSKDVSGGSVGSGVLYHCNNCDNVFGV